MAKTLRQIVRQWVPPRSRDAWHNLSARAQRLFRKTASAGAAGIGPVYLFVRSYNRSKYLWPCLDSLFRCTKFPCRVVFVDNASTDPAVSDIVSGFERRGLFHAVHFMDQNLPSNQNMVFLRHRNSLGRYFVLIDSDIIIEPGDPCWLTRLVGLAERRPDLGVIGSAVDREDFVDGNVAGRLHPEMSQAEIHDLVKAHSPERQLPQSRQEIIRPFYPPGRLLLLRTDIFRDTGPPIGNANICRAANAAGFGNGIATQVRHRHLSLLNVFDYPSYDYAELRNYLRAS